jgi:hypothetical protein
MPFLQRNSFYWIESQMGKVKGLFQPRRLVWKSLRKVILRFALVLELVALLLAIGWNFRCPLMRTVYAVAGPLSTQGYAPQPTGDTPTPIDTNTTQPSSTPIATAAGTKVATNTQRAAATNTSKSQVSATKTKTALSTSTGGTPSTKLASPTKEPTNTKTKTPTKTTLFQNVTGGVSASTATFSLPPNTNQDITGRIFPELILIGVIIIGIIIVGGIIYFAIKSMT